MRMAIIGAGSLGTITGALMTRAGHMVDLVDVNRDHVVALNRDGARIVGEMDVTVPVRAIVPDAMCGVYDRIFLLNKQTANQDVLRRLLPHLRDDSLVCTLQNGIPELSVADVIGKERTIGGAVGFGATWIRPGVSALTSPVEALAAFAFEIGEIDGVPRARLEDVRACLASVGGTRIVTDLMSIRWTKLLINATFSGMSAALGCSFGAVLDNRHALASVAFIANETIAVAHAEGHRLTRMYGEDIEAFAFEMPGEIAAKLPMMRRIWTPHRALRASMLQDLEKGRDTEIGFINGIVCAAGRRHGIATPFNDCVVECVEAAQGLRQLPGPENIVRFENLLAAEAASVPIE